MKSIALIFGTRPEAIKLAPVYLELMKHPSDFAPQLWVTGQHRQMLDQVMDAFELKADRDFEVMTPGQTLSSTTSAVLTALEPAFKSHRPDLVLVQGDTTTAFAASLASFYAQIPVGHVEAGLRTATKLSPFPEEMNRRLTTRLADLHFAPTSWSQENLLRDGVRPDHLWVTGNTVIDALETIVTKVRKTPPQLHADIPAHLFDGKAPLILITGHRRENFGSGFESLCHAIAELADRYAHVNFLYPVHLNPNVLEPVHRILSGRTNVHLTQPFDYPSFVWAMDRSYLILSDSGGIQEEAPHLGKPVLVMRETTERPEAIEAGTSLLVGTDRERIVREVSRLLDNQQAYAAMSQAKNPFGDGKASERIVEACRRFLNAEVRGEIPSV